MAFNWRWAIQEMQSKYAGQQMYESAFFSCSCANVPDIYVRWKIIFSLLDYSWLGIKKGKLLEVSKCFKATIAYTYIQILTSKDSEDGAQDIVGLGFSHHRVVILLCSGKNILVVKFSLLPLWCILLQNSFSLWGHILVELWQAVFWYNFPYLAEWSLSSIFLNTLAANPLGLNLV